MADERPTQASIAFQAVSAALEYLEPELLRPGYVRPDSISREVVLEFLRKILSSDLRADVIVKACNIVMHSYERAVRREAELFD